MRVLTDSLSVWIWIVAEPVQKAADFLREVYSFVDVSRALAAFVFVVVHQSK